MLIRPVRTLYTPIERIPPLYPPHPFADERDLLQGSLAKSPAAQQPDAGIRSEAPSLASPPDAFITYTSQGEKHVPPQSKGALLDTRI
ncbi:hypothetical protein COLU111180_10460 [Cohnella lubricantis]|uniref:Uncharacterized protein n=1 Tax=Cohnella lubricantis TaxID=2163172 RepID=A0A841TGW5_9BACL|nr:hypothetical protein [Cohnella lubricantis]MBB6678480.1 hypothetical protein [Cohnella lubricantis]MBP2118403.1 hypothetical protein [Cohnella lubricantis]